MVNWRRYQYIFITFKSRYKRSFTVMHNYTYQSDDLCFSIVFSLTWKKKKFIENQDGFHNYANSLVIKLIYSRYMIVSHLHKLKIFSSFIFFFPNNGQLKRRKLYKHTKVKWKWNFYAFKMRRSCLIDLSEKRLRTKMTLISLLCKFLVVLCSSV